MNATTKSKLNRGMLIAVAIIIVATLEQVLFGRDHAGTAHDISVGAFLLSLVALVAVLGLLAARVALAVRQR
jgi:hypothetical protein